MSSTIRTARNDDKTARVAYAAAPDNEVAERALRAIRRILRGAGEHSRRLSKETGLTTTQLLCLRWIGQAGAREEITAAQLTDAVRLSAATVSRVLDRLESRGLVSRERASRDRRKLRLKLTRAGRARLRRLPVPLQESFLAQLNELPPQERLRVVASLETVVRMMGAEQLDAAPVITPGDIAGA